MGDEEGTKTRSCRIPFGQRISHGARERLTIPRQFGQRHAAREGFDEHDGVASPGDLQHDARGRGADGLASAAWAVTALCVELRRMRALCARHETSVGCTRFYEHGTVPSCCWLILDRVGAGIPRTVRSVTMSGNTCITGLQVAPASVKRCLWPSILKT